MSKIMFGIGIVCTLVIVTVTSATPIVLDDDANAENFDGRMPGLHLSWGLGIDEGRTDEIFQDETGPTAADTDANKRRTTSSYACNDRIVQKNVSALQTASVPEPATLIFLTFSSLTVLLRKKYKR